MERKVENNQRRLLVSGIVLGALFAGMHALGGQLAAGVPDWIAGTVRGFFIWLPVAAAVSVILLRGWDCAAKWLGKSTLERKCSGLMDRKGILWIMWAGIFLMWMPAFLASYPGVYVIDNVFQLQWFMEGKVSAHHPVIHTYLLGLCVEGGRKLLGSYEAGLGVYSVLQMAAMSGIFSYTVYALKDRLPALVRLVCVLLYAFLPCHAVSSFTATKDILYAGFFLLVLLKTYEMVVDMDSFFGSKRRIAEYVLLLFLSFCFRNTGIYVFLCMVPAFFLVCRRFWKQVMAVTLAAVALWGVFTGPVYGILGIGGGSSAEILSVPMQQMSRALVAEGDKFSEKEKQEILRYIPDYERYEPKVADPVKDTFRAGEFEKNPAEFVKIWLKTGMKCPDSYLQAFFLLNMGFWWPGMEFPDPGTYLAYIPYKNADTEQVGKIAGKTIYMERKSVLPGLEKFYQSHVEDGGFEKLPLLSYLYSTGAFLWFICFGIVLCIYKKRYKMAVPFSLTAALWLSLMVSPVVVFRYAYPIVVSLPVLTAMMCREKSGSAEVKQ